MSNLDYIIHQIRSEIKTNPTTGKSVCSIRGTARLADIDFGGLAKTLKTGVEPEPSKMATFLTEQGFEGVELAKWGEIGIPDMAVGAILEYYAFEAGRYNTEQAKLVYRAFARIGVQEWMRDLTGWKKPAEQKIDIREFVIAQLPQAALPWEMRFPPEFWIALENLYGLKRGQRACGQFISYYVYGYFPKEVVDRLNEINPQKETGVGRANKHHQHFDDVLLKALKMQISLVTQTLMKSKTRQHFKRQMKAYRRYKFTQDNLQQLGGN